MTTDRERSLAVGYRHHLVKPMAPEQIERILESVEPHAADGAPAAPGGARAAPDRGEPASRPR